MLRSLKSLVDEDMSLTERKTFYGWLYLNIKTEEEANDLGRTEAKLWRSLKASI